MAQGDLFDVLTVERVVPTAARVAQLISWAAKLAELGFTPSYGPGDHGNMSVRTDQGLVITARATTKASLRAEDFVEVIGLQRRGSRAVVRCRGTRLPSTDTLLHLRLYEARPDIGAILHGHDPATLAQAGSLELPMTKHSASVPSLELIEEVCRLTAQHTYIVMRDHGFLALGRSVDEAGAMVQTWSHRARTAVPGS